MCEDFGLSEEGKQILVYQLSIDVLTVEIKIDEFDEDLDGKYYIKNKFD